MRKQLRILLVVLAVAVAVAVAPAWCREGQSTWYSSSYNNNTMNSAAAEAVAADEAPLVTAVIVFGDSIVDPGNNNDLKTGIKANHAPYGMDFADGPTGRFSNGLIPTDFIAQGLKVKQLLPPYLGVELSPEDLRTGVSFASGATGYDPMTPVIVSVITLEQQLEYFDEYRGKLVALYGEEETARIIDGALFVVCAGTDDIANTYFTTPFRSAEYDIPSYVELLGVRRGGVPRQGEGARRPQGRLREPAAHRVRAVAADARRRPAPAVRGEAQRRGQAVQLPDAGGGRRQEQAADADGVHRHLRHPGGAGGERRQVRVHGDDARVLRHGHHRGHEAVRRPLPPRLRRRKLPRLLRQLPPNAARLQDHRRLHLPKLHPAPARLILS
ncbi:hypothetical protein GUJ93_ZPchr0003g18585 [Zizania palustris]|uniref:Uncharacterized protein n=1 Tax=Zizania palustris TaxID=103762 RepID=A0A8J5VWK1_ZIZPA|nr:hypothetical protein GUJ93_ZPchr0003g18585 [Zizania palustris]